jgi:group I intron endonuclease
MRPPILITGAARSGIYQIICNETGKRYVGSSTNIEHRFNGHIKDLNRGAHCNRHLQRAWTKYGPEKFEFGPILFCAPENLVLYEQAAIDALEAANPACGYNICPVAESRLGAQFTEESKRRLSESRKGKYVGTANHNYGKTLRESVRKKISESLIGRFVGENSPTYGMKHSKETRMKISAAGKGRPAWNKGLTADMDLRVKKYTEAQRGKSISEKQREQISKALKGAVPSNETRKKLSEAQTRRWSNPQERERQSDRRKGKPSGFLGRNHSEETKQKMRLAHARRKQLCQS